MNETVFAYETAICSAKAESSGKGGAYVVFPHDVRTVFGKGRAKVRVTFDGEPYDGSVVNMGVQNSDGSVCYVIGILKAIRVKLGKGIGDTVRMTVRERG